MPLNKERNRHIYKYRNRSINMMMFDMDENVNDRILYIINTDKERLL